MLRLLQKAAELHKSCPAGAFGTLRAQRLVRSSPSTPLPRGCRCSRGRFSAVTAAVSLTPVGSSSQLRLQQPLSPKGIFIPHRDAQPLALAPSP